MGSFTYIGTGALIARGHSALRVGVARSAEHLAQAAQAEAGVDTGTLRAGIHVEGPSGGGGGVIARVSTGGESNEYAVFHHEGTGAHPITAHGGALAWPGGAHPVKTVQHPGTAANPFLERPLLANRDAYLAYIAAAARAVY